MICRLVLILYICFHVQIFATFYFSFIFLQEVSEPSRSANQPVSHISKAMNIARASVSPPPLRSPERPFLPRPPRRNFPLGWLSEREEHYSHTKAETQFLFRLRFLFASMNRCPIFFRFVSVLLPMTSNFLFKVCPGPGGVAR